MLLCPLAQKLKQSTLSKIGLTSSRHCADCHAHHKLKIGTTCAMDLDYEHVAFLSCSQTVWCRKNVTKKCIRTSESSRVGARRSRVTASTRNNPACEHLSTTSALGRLLTPGAAFATLPLRGALPEQLLSQDISLSQSGSDCATLRGKPGRVTRMHQQRHA